MTPSGPIRRFAWIVPAALLWPVAGMAQGAAPRGEQTKSPVPDRPVFEKTGVLPTQEGLRLQLVTPMGDVRILTRGSGPAEVSYRVWMEAGANWPDAEKHAQEPLVSARSTPEGVTITGNMPRRNFRGRLAVEYEVTVPRNYNLDVRTQAGDIRIDDIDGQANLYSGGGKITAGRIGGSAKLQSLGGHIVVQDVGGSLYASTAGGHISAGEVQGEAVLRSAGGHISAISVQGPAQLETAGGNISLQHAGSIVTASTAGGRIDLGEASGAIKARTAGGGIRVVRLAGPTQLETRGGSIYLTSVQGAVKASTAAGSITAWLAGRLQGISQFESGNGDILVYIPRELPITVEASIAGAAHRIDADPGLPLKILSGSGPDAQEVRAEAALNGGGDVVRVKAGSGNIKLKFSDPLRSYYEQIYKLQMQQFEQNCEGAQQSERAREQLLLEKEKLQEEKEKLGAIEEWQLRLREKIAGRIPVDADVQKQKLIYQVGLIYPEIAKRDRIEGIVWLEAQIDKEGKVEGLKAIKGNPVLAQAAMDAVRQWRYAPTYLGGKAVAVTTVIRLEFRLE